MIKNAIAFSLCDHRFDLDADFTRIGGIRVRLCGEGDCHERAKRESDVGGIWAADNHMVTVLRLGALEPLAVGKHKCAVLD